MLAHPLYVVYVLALIPLLCNDHLTVGADGKSSGGGSAGGSGAA